MCYQFYRQIGQSSSFNAVNTFAQSQSLHLPPSGHGSLGNISPTFNVNMKEGKEFLLKTSSDFAVKN